MFSGISIQAVADASYFITSSTRAVKMMLKFFIAAQLLGSCCSVFMAKASEAIQEDSISVVGNFEATDAEVPSGDNMTATATEDIRMMDDNDYMRDLRNSMTGKGMMNPETIYTAQAMLPAGELLVLSTASGCSLLNDAEGAVPGRMEPLEFSFRLADLEDCGKVTEGIINELQAEIAAEWANLGGSQSEGVISSSTRLQEIGMRSGNKSAQDNVSKDTDFNASVQDLANAFLAANLEVNLLPTSSAGIFVMHFDISGNTSAEEITQMMANIDTEKLKEVSETIKSMNDKIMNATPEDLAKMEQEFKNFVESNQAVLAKEVEDGKNILEELSHSGQTSIECSALSLGSCDSVSKCDVVKLNGKETCMVSPKTIFLLMETNCGLQSKAGLLSIVRDLVNVGLMNEANHQTLRQSFNLAQICNSIVHTYLSADIAETEQHEAKRTFEL